MKTLSSRERVLILLGLIVIVVSAVMLTNQPAGARSGANEQHHSGEVAAELTRTQEEVADLEAQIERRMVKGTPRQLVREMIQTSQAAARTAKLEIDDLKPVEPQNTPGFRRVPVQISLSAPFPKVVRFLYELQRRRDRYRVDQLQMSTATGVNDRIDIDFQLVAFVQGDETDAGS